MHAVYHQMGVYSPRCNLTEQDTTSTTAKDSPAKRGQMSKLKNKIAKKMTHKIEQSTSIKLP